MQKDGLWRRIENVFQGRYEYVDKLGSGGMGMVLLVQARDLGRKLYALKIIDKNSPENKGIDVYAEIQILKTLRHPNIVTIYEALEDEGYVYIVQEYIDGRTLAALRDDQTTKNVIDDETVRLWMIDIADAMAYLHGMNIVHRDIKPGNIMIDGDGMARLIDFGIARRISTISKRKAGNTVGSAPYSPLERLEGKSDGKQTDIYAYGTSFYSLLCRQIPSISGREINTMRTSNQSIKPYYMNAYRTMIDNLENIDDDGIRDIIRSCVEIDSANRISDFNTIRYRLRSIDEVKQEHEFKSNEYSKAKMRMIALLIAGIILAGFGCVQMHRDHTHKFDKIIQAADKAYSEANFVKSEEEADRAIEFDPNNESGYFSKYKAITGAAYELNNDSEYERLISVINNDAIEQPSIKDSIYTVTYLANAYFECDEPKKTAEILSPREDLGDDQLLLLGYALYRNGENVKADSCLENISKGTQQKYYLEGLVSEKHNISHAEECYENVLTSESNNSIMGNLSEKALSQLVRIYRDQNNYAKAIKKIENESEKNGSVKNSAKINMMLMDCYYDSGNYGDAANQADNVIKKFKNSHAYEIKLSSQIKRDNYDDALATISAWEGAFPKDVTPHVQRVIIYNNLAGAAHSDEARADTYPDFIKAYEEESSWLVQNNIESSEMKTLENAYYDAVDELRRIKAEG